MGGLEEKPGGNPEGGGRGQRKGGPGEFLLYLKGVGVPEDSPGAGGGEPRDPSQGCSGSWILIPRHISIPAGSSGCACGPGLSQEKVLCSMLS